MSVLKMQPNRALLFYNRLKATEARISRLAFQLYEIESRWSGFFGWKRRAEQREVRQELYQVADELRTLRAQMRDRYCKR